MTMNRSFAGADRQPQATTGNHRQGEMPMGLCAVREPQRLPADLLGAVTFSGTLNEAMRNSGQDDHEVADAIHVCHGYFSRFMRGVAQQWAKRLVAFMRVTNSLAPLQWIANEMGCEVTSRDSLAHRLAAAEAQAAELRRQVQGRAAA